MTPRFSVIVVTSGRPTLDRTLSSIAAQALSVDDEVLVVGKGPEIQALAEKYGYRYVEDGPFGCWGQRERQAAMAKATGTHLLFMDDDDYYLDGAFAAIRSTVSAWPGHPVMFRMYGPSHVGLIWRSLVVACGNVSGTQFVVPNDDRLGTWSQRYEGDFDFITSTLRNYPPDALVWDDSIIVGCRDQGVPAVAPKAWELSSCR